MRPNQLLLTGLFTFVSFIAFADIEIAGVYQGKNVYVQNPFASNMTDYCTREVFVNDKLIMSDVKSSAYEIDLSHLRVNEPIVLRISHRSDCQPKVLNPQVLKVKTNFSFSGVNITKEKISWSSQNELPKGRYFVERFEYNVWKVVAEKYSEGSSRYEIDVHHHTGDNKYRVKYFDEKGIIVYSNVIDYLNEEAPVTFYPQRVTDRLYLTRQADYEILDQYGNVLSTGFKNEINLKEAQSGLYYLNVDNKTHKFYKK